ncbi:hypothetical protein BH09PLA1_BH09PLA1_07700 [soil metagenome]
MRKFLPLILLLLASASGCQTDAPFARSVADTQLFGPVSMRLHPIFTQIKDWSGDGKPDGVEALIELQDQFGDPTKASGRIVFELFEYQPYNPERRGDRVLNPWIGYLETLDEQRDRWNRTSRTYSFQLENPAIQTSKTYVLTAEFQLSGGGRFFDQIILEGRRAESESLFPPTTAPTNSPAPDGPGPRTPQP